MSNVTQPLRDEHRHLLPHIDRLAGAADRIDAETPGDLRREVDEVYAWLVEHLIPHAEAEDAALYPVVERFLGVGSTKTMSRDHVEVGRLTGELGSLRDRVTPELDPDVARELRRILYGLHALVRVHFAKEEEVYLPVLEERLSPEDAEEMFAAMHAAH